MNFDQFENINLSAEDMARVLGLSPGYIQQLVREKDFPKSTYNSYCVVEFIGAYIKHLQDTHKKDIRKIKDSLDGSESRIKAATARLKEIELEEKELSLIPAKQVRDNLLNWVSIFVKGLEMLSKKLPLLLIDADKNEYSEIISTETNRLRNSIANMKEKRPEYLSYPE